MERKLRSYKEYNDTRFLHARIEASFYSKEEFDLCESLLGGRETVNKRGKLAKRLRSNVKRELGYKLTPEQMSTIGNIAANHSTASGKFLYEDTNVMDMAHSSGFGDDSSCFYLEYGSGHNFHHRIAMEQDQDERFRLIKVYSKEDEPTARAFVYTDLSDGAQLVFNAYGALSRIKIASILATDLDLGVSRKVQFTSDVYINDDGASAIGGDQDCESYHVRINVGDYVDQVHEYDEYSESCENCDQALDTEYGEYRIDEDTGSYYCEDCYLSIFTYCNDCNQEYDTRHTLFYDVGTDSESVCETCYRNNYAECEECGNLDRLEDMDEINGAILCDSCQSSSTGNCVLCEERYYPCEKSEREYCESCTDSLKIELLRASESNCPTCFTADGRPFNNLVVCPDCRAGLHFDCDDCRVHPLGTCANHYSVTKYVDTNKSYLRVNDQFPLTCDHCDDFHNQMIKDKIGNNHVAYCLTCYSERTLKDHLRYANEHLQHLITNQAAAQDAAQYLEAHTSLANELTGESFSTALGGPQLFYLQKARAAGRYPHGLNPYVSDVNFATHVQDELDHRTDMINTFKLRISESMKEVKSAIDKMIDASGKGDILADLAVPNDRPVLHGASVIDTEKDLDTYADYYNYIFDLYIEAEEAEIAVLDDLEDLGILAHGNELSANSPSKSPAPRPLESAAIQCEQRQEDLIYGRRERPTLEHIHRNVTTAYFDREIVQVRESYIHRPETMDLRLNILRDQQVADTCGVCELHSTACDTCPVAAARLIDASMTLTGNDNPYTAAANCVARGEASILHSWGDDHEQDNCDRCRLMADRERDELEQAARQATLEAATGEVNINLSAIPCDDCGSTTHSASAHYCRACNGYGVSGTRPNGLCTACRRNCRRNNGQGNNHPFFTPLLDRAEADEAAAAIFNQWRAASSYVPVQDRPQPLPAWLGVTSLDFTSYCCNAASNRNACDCPNGDTTTDATAGADSEYTWSSVDGRARTVSTGIGELTITINTGIEARQ